MAGEQQPNATQVSPSEKPETRGQTTIWRRRFRLLLVGTLFLLVAGSLSAWLLANRVLTVDSGPVKADVLVVLGGGGLERPKRAAELFKAGAAPRVICTGMGDCEQNRRFLIKSGVPASAIEVESASRSTKQNAQFTIKLLRAEGVKRAIIVTTWYHSRRGLECFRHYDHNIQFYSRPSYYAYPRDEWRREGVRGYIRDEYVKLLGYWVCYGVAPF